MLTGALGRKLPKQKKKGKWLLGITKSSCDPFSPPVIQPKPALLVLLSERIQNRRPLLLASPPGLSPGLFSCCPYLGYHSHLRTGLPATPSTPPPTKSLGKASWRVALQRLSVMSSTLQTLQWPPGPLTPSPACLPASPP